MAGADYTQALVDALNSKYQEDHHTETPGGREGILREREPFFAAATNETLDRVFQFVRDTPCPVADVDVISGDVLVVSKRGNPVHNISTPEGLDDLLKSDITWEWRS